MGLDIYFEKRKKNFNIKSYNELIEKRNELEEKVNYKIFTQVIEGGEVPQGTTDDEVNYIKTYNALDIEINETNPRQEVAYFHKVNPLVAYFDYDDNCTYKEISKDSVEKLVELCDEVLKDHSKAKELLPTQSGFCFGSCEYDDLYFMKVEKVKTKFEEVLGNIDWEDEILEMYCWW